MNELCEKYYWLIDEAINNPNETRVTIKGILAKFAGEVVEPEVKPRTRIEYAKVEESIFDLGEDYKSGNLRHLISSEDEDSYFEIESNKKLAIEWLNENLYRKVEVEIPWYEYIPIGGVLCWYNSDVCVISDWSCDDELLWVKDGGSIGLYDAKPLTKSQIEVFMNNAPSSLTDKPKG